LFFLKSILNSSAPIDRGGWWWNTIWAIFAICFGGYVAVFTEKEIQTQIRWAKKWNSRLRITLWPIEREKYNFNFTRSMGALFVLIGIAVLIKNLIG